MSPSWCCAEPALTAAARWIEGVRRSGTAALTGGQLPDLLREVFANPLIMPPKIDPAWLRWQDGTVRSLAQAAYDGRRFPSGFLDNTRLAILADALKEAGCHDLAMLSHLRSGGDHVRGCFVVDALLEKL
jgi:hypothetical protein